MGLRLKGVLFTGDKFPPDWKCWAPTELAFILAGFARGWESLAPGCLLQPSKHIPSPTPVAARWWAWECFWALPPLLLALPQPRPSGF